MKSSSILHFAAALRSRCLTLRPAACAAAAAALLGLGSSSLLAQGSYYPVSPAGSPYGTTYTGTPVVNAPDLYFLQNTLQALFGPTVTLQVPPPTGTAAPTPAQLAAGVEAATMDILAGSAPGGVDLATFSRQVVAYRPAERGTTVDRLAKAIVNDTVTAAAKIANLNTVTGTLATTHPLLIDTIVPSILGQAKTIAAVAEGIPQLVSTVISAIPRDSTRINSVVGAGVSSIATAALTAAAKTTLFLDPATGYVPTLLANAQVDNNPALIDVIVKKFTEGSALALVPPTTDTPLEQVLTASVDALSTQNKSTVGALAAGALRSQGGSAAAIQARLNSELSATPLLAQHTNELVDGYTSGGTLASYQAQLAANTNADAVAQGATVRAALATGVIVREALVAEQATGIASLTTARDVVKAVVAANLDQVLATVNGAINGLVPYGDATFADIAGGAVNAARIEQAGSITQTTIQRTSASLATLVSATVNSIVDAAIVGADETNKEGAFTDIVYKAQGVVRNSPSAVSVSMVGQAITSIGAATTEVPLTVNRPHYIALVAALAADNGANRTAIRNAALGGGGQIVLAGGDLTAATSGADLVRDIIAAPAKAYATTLSALFAAESGASPTNSVKADVYASVLANSTESSGMLATAIKQSSVSVNVLTDAAIDAIRGITAGKDQTLRLVRDVADYLKTNSIAETLDILDYVGHQIIDNPTLTRDIAEASVVIDPNHSHFIAHAVGFNNPTNAASAIVGIFKYSQVTSPAVFDRPNAGNPSGAPLGAKAYLSGTKGVVIDQPAVAAAITAGIVSGILEGLPSASQDAARKSALISTVQNAVASAINQNNTNLQGPANPFNFGGDSNPGINPAADTTENFRQSNGGVGTIKSGVVRTVGAAGAITGYIAQVTKAGDTSIVKYTSGETATVAGSVTFAVLQAAASGGARIYALEIAQAAAQALRWIGGAGVGAQAATDIANAMAPVTGGFATFAQLFHAATFGIAEAANGTIGAGALGLNATGLDAGTAVVRAAGNANADFYVHRSATGTPVTDVLNL